MRYGFETKDGQQFEFIGEMTMSVGSGMVLDSRYGFDASKRPQSLVRRKRNQAKTASVNIGVNRLCSPNLFDLVQQFETLSGMQGTLIWSSIEVGYFCVKDISFSFALDAIDIVSAVQISMNLAECYVEQNKKAKQRNKQVDVHLL